MEQTISSLRDTVDNLVHRNSELSDKIIHIQHHLSKATETNVKDTKQQAISVKVPPLVDVKQNKQLLVDERHSHYTEKLADKYLGNNNRVGRQLQSSIFGTSSSHRCDELPLLSPINHLSNFEYDERVDRMLDVIQKISSVDLLNRNDTPQYKAACWVLFDDIYEFAVNDNRFIQRYVLAVSLHAIFPSQEVQISRNTCDHDVVTCNDEGHIIKIQLSEYNAAKLN